MSRLANSGKLIGLTEPHHTLHAPSDSPPDPAAGAPALADRSGASWLVGSVLRDPLGSALLAALSIAVVELVALDTAALAISAVVLALFAGLGALIGLVLTALDLLVQRWRLRGAMAAAVRSLGAIPLFWATARSLFDGAYASSLPLASLGHIWVPALLYLGLVATVALLARWCVGGATDSGRRRRRIAVVVVLLGLAVVAEWGNRNLFTSGYPDLHAFLIVVSCVAVACALRVAGDLSATPPGAAYRGRRSALMTAIVALVVALPVAGGLWAALTWGLSDSDDRWTVAMGGNHARHLVRVVRDLGDRDDDGFARVLGGGDCDDGDAHINPGARDVPGNGIDEDCDGVDSAVIATPSPPPTDAQARAAWYASEPVRALLDNSAQYHVLLVSVDTLRADALPTGAWPSTSTALPALHELFARSTVFANAFATASGTDVSLGGVVTGRINPFVRLQPTLAEAYRATGRATHGVIAREVLRYAGKTLLTRGLRSHDEVINDREQINIGSHATADEVTDHGLAFLDRWHAEKTATADAAARFFLWLHYFDVHEHHQLPPDPALLELVDPERALSDARRRYQALVALTDRSLARLFAGLEQRGLAERTIVVFVSDHGEALGADERLPEHHGNFVYNALVHVPLAIAVPGVPPQVIARPVSLLDLFPTLLALAGIAVPERADGMSLVPQLLPGAPPSALGEGRALVMNEQQQWGVIEWPYKLMMRPADNLIELYDIARDAGETENLARARPELVRRLKDRYAAFPSVPIDRTRKGRRWREQQAQPP